MVPKLDNLIGISVYCTREEGTGGRIRVDKEGFSVSEVLDERALGRISDSGNYPVFKLKKSGIDTNHALSEIFQRYGLRLKALGLKDANATTEQFVCSMSVSRSHKEITTNRYVLERIGFVQKPLTKKDMVGNHFRISIEDADFSRISNFDQQDKILNFFGYQRFGSKRAISHLVGKAMLQQDFDQAVEILLSATSEYDLAENNAIREMLKDKSNYSKVSSEMPPQMDIERLVLKEMIAHGDALRALRAVPVFLRRFFVESYQSFIFNRTVSISYEMGEDLFGPHANDVCYDRNGNLGIYQNDPEQRLAVPLVGYSYSRKNRFEYEISKVLEAENVTPKNFFIKEMQEASSEGGFRHAVMVCKDFAINKPQLSFTLSRGSYATVLLREIMKPSDPVSAGF